MLIYDQYFIRINFVYVAIKIINLTNRNSCIIFAVETERKDNLHNLKNYKNYVKREITRSNQRAD